MNGCTVVLMRQVENVQQGMSSKSVKLKKKNGKINEKISSNDVKST